ncbi:MAG TPA: META domain-containing protein [Saprospiraceae bacterium]|nr:META domain-containing protein [Saprospiraceae bacterium]
MRLMMPLLAMLIILTSSTCRDTSNKTPNNKETPLNILDTLWHLQSLTLAGKSQAIYPATLKINEAKISGNGGCNNFFGKYKIEQNRLTISNIGATRKYCPKTGKFERKYLSALEKVTSYKLEKERLILTLPDGQIIFSPQPTKITQNDAEGTIYDIIWHLKSFSKKGRTQSIQPTITLLIGKKKISGNGGCNSYFGQYRKEGNRFTISGIGATEMYCKETSNLENDYFQALEKVSSYRFGDNQLVLIYPDGELIFGRK